jgi:hypothetical protein
MKWHMDPLLGHPLILMLSAESNQATSTSELRRAHKVQIRIN